MKVACPTCGAEVDFRYDDSFVRVCGHCKAAVVRGDRGPASLGTVADLAPTGSPLALFAEGRFQGQGFMLVGRAQYQHPAGGVWDEWYARLDDARWGWLAEAQGRFYLTFETVGAGTPPPFTAVFPGASVQLEDDGPRLFTVGERGVAELAGAEGEIPFRFVPGTRFAFADLADGSGRFATIDYGDLADERAEPTLYLGRQVSLAELGLAGGEAAAPARAIAGRQLACPSCGGSIELRAPDASKRVVCPYCSSLLACEGDLRLVAALHQAKDPGLVPLGARGTFGGVTYTVIGRLKRQAGGAAGTIDDDELGAELWTWNEYLLYEPSVGFRWLVESSGHWSFVTTLPPGAVELDGGRVRYDGRSFRLFDQATATVIGVWGELYWRVEKGESVDTADHVAPPAMLSRETSADEENWSLGLYRTPAEIDRAFGGGLTLPGPDGVGAIQPFKHRHAGRTFALLLLALGALTVVRGCMATKTRVYEATLALDPPPAEAQAELPPGSGDQRLLFTEPFELAARKNVEIRIEVPIDNAWVFVAGDLVHEATGELETFEKELSYYHGFEGGESWTEGSRGARLYMPAVKPGRYLLRLEVLQPPEAHVDQVQVTIRQGVFRYSHVIIALVLIGVPGLVLALWHWSFERRRWKNSDHAPSGLRAGDDE